MNHIDLSLSNILESMRLNEDSNLADFRDNKDKINYAIDNRLMISLYYDDGKGDKGRKPAYGNPRGFRRIIPYCLGSRKGRLALRGFHAWKTHTKKGPFKWKFFYLDRMSNVRVYKNMPIPYIPELANPDGDSHMDEIINMIGMQKFQSPLDREKQTTQDLKNTTSSELNKQGAIKQLNKGGLKSLQNLKPIPSKTKKVQYNFQNTAKNLQDFEKQNTEMNRDRRWADYDKAERERQEQVKQAEAPNPPTSNSGPVSQNDMEGYEQNMNNNNKENR